jgi:hypothetical protein
MAMATSTRNAQRGMVAAVTLKKDEGPPPPTFLAEADRRYRPKPEHRAAEVSKTQPST